MKMKLISFLTGALLFSITSTANAGVIISATGGTINSGGPGFGTLTETFDQSGLLSGYTPGVTDFDTYIASNPMHSLIFAGNEWFSNDPTESASVTYDFGGTVTIDALALWNEEGAGIGLLDLLYSINGTDFFALAGGLTPTDNPGNTDYGTDIFSFAATSMNFIRLDMSRCPQPDGSFPSCSIGEVAFREGVTDAPEPAALGMLGFGLIGLGIARRRRLKK